MCGIAGILKFNANAVVEEARLVGMRDKLVHRGPDGAGVVVRGNVGLAHRRLSIIDLAGGHQPMANEAGDVWLTYNGEVYNFRELRTSLQEQGMRFSSHSDTEVILRAYERYGEDCVTYLHGMFAFAIWDGKKQTLLIARDRLGIKPLYYSRTDQELLFASEIKSLLVGSSQPVRFNRAALPEYLAARYVASDATFFEGVQKLLPGHVLTWSAAKGVVIKRYWSPGQVQERSDYSLQDYTDAVRAELEASVKRHLVSDVPVGLFLSGGLDSTILAGVMAQQMSEPLQTFSVGFSEQSANELHYARLAADHVGAKHRECVVTPDQFFAQLPKLIWHEDEPIAFTSSIPLNIISNLAKQHVKVVLTGEGADELFLGYDYRYRVSVWNVRLAQRYHQWVPEGLRNVLGRSVNAMPRRVQRYAKRSFLAMDNTPRDLFFENFSVFNRQQRNAVLSSKWAHVEERLYSEGVKYYEAAGDEALACMSQADLQTYLVELLMKQDQMSMAASIESRVPFLDDQLVDLVTSIPTRYRLRNGRTKALLRDATRDLVPDAIRTRSKMGFPVPMGEWLRGKYWSIVEEFVIGERALARGLLNADAVKQLAYEHRNGVQNHAERLWLLINLEMWQRIFIDGEQHEAMYLSSKPVSHTEAHLRVPVAAASF
jgi:asparagine synthase (glutamine-hydrolysing)